MKKIAYAMLGAAAALACTALLVAQGPAGGKGGPGGGPGGPGGAKGGGFGRGPAFSVTSTAFPDGGEVPLDNAGGRGGANKSPAFEFHWSNGNTPADPPMTLQTYAVVFHDIENSTNKTTEDTLHWSAFNIPGTAKGLTGGLAAGDLPDGTHNGPGIAAGRGTPAYFGPGAGVGPFHHYVFEFYALDTKLDNSITMRDALMKAMDGHVLGKAAYVGRFHTMP